MATIESNLQANLTEKDANPAASGAHPTTLAVQSVYLKDISFKITNAINTFQGEWKPKLDLNLQIQTEILSEQNHIYEVVLQATIVAKLNDGTLEKEVFTSSVQQAGAFKVDGVSGEILNRVLQITCPAILFPHAREALGSLAARGGFAQLTLPSVISFEAIYALQEKAKQGKSQQNRP